ncbi:sodium- and chloride-dependent GABA transporter 1 [Rhincodon typus]|uniref:sodium- and chloride-dependent GABA transporter 1 n=1 Tax=Rhincodon typus TaxID=259920 RepID=UPI00202EC1A6|nr:sodium- and chloride-dependent GABA transporter 1 [Rhincodon typus]
MKNIEMSNSMEKINSVKTRKACDITAQIVENANKNENAQTRVTWTRKIEFTLAGIGYSVGLGNVWRFPFLCYRSGGGAFLIPFFIMFALLGIPLLYLEISIGQYLRTGPVESLAKICPLLKGVGLATVAISFVMSTYYNLIICWAMYYLIHSFQNPLPWHSCNNTWNIQETCTDSITTNNITVSASQQFFDYNVLQKTNGLDDLGNMRWELFGLLILAWVIVYFCIFKGVTWTGKVWVYAAVQVFNSIGIGFGSLISMSSYNKPDNNILRDTLAISLTNAATSIFSGFVIFSAFGYMSHMINIPIDDIAVDGPGLVFVVYPEAFVTMPVSPLWAVLFFIMLLFLGLDSEFAMVEVMVTSLLDANQGWLLKYLKRKEFVVLGVCVVAFMLGIPNVTQGGIYVFQLLDHYTAQVSIVFLAFFEIVAVCCIYGLPRLSQNIEEMLGKKPNIYLRVCWLLSPVLILIIMVFVIIDFEPVRYGTYQYPEWGQGLGWVIAFASLIWIPVGVIHTLLTLKGSFHERFIKSTTPFGLDYDSKQTGVARTEASQVIPMAGGSPSQQNEILKNTSI